MANDLDTLKSSTSATFDSCRQGRDAEPRQPSRRPIPSGSAGGTTYGEIAEELAGRSYADLDSKSSYEDQGGHPRPRGNDDA